MIHLIRKFINTENTALNLLIDEGNKDVKSKIGSAGDTGGSATAGTVMSKLNKIISDLTTHVTNWTSTRAGYIDNIRSYTVTNNTASKTGVLSAKLAYVISLLENTTYGLSAIKTNGVPVSSLSGKIIKSVQRGVISLEQGKSSATATISSVKTSKAIVIYTGVIYPSAYDHNYSGMAGLVLTNSTTVTASRYAFSDSGGLNVPYQVIEFY